MSWDEGGFGSHEMSMVEIAGCDRFRLEIYGTRGTMWLRTERGPLALYAPEFLGRAGWFVPKLPDVALGVRQHQAWINGLTGAAPRQQSAAAGLRSLLVAEAIDRSAGRNGRREAVEAA